MTEELIAALRQMLWVIETYAENGQDQHLFELTQVLASAMESEDQATADMAAEQAVATTTIILKKLIVG